VNHQVSSRCFAAIACAFLGCAPAWAAEKNPVGTDVSIPDTVTDGADYSIDV